MNFSDLLNPKPCRWPKKDDRPFRNATYPDIAGELASDGFTRGVFIMHGFMLAGAALADQVLNANNRLERNTLVYPMLFCYRHALETGLKWLITQYGPSVHIRPECLSESHDIMSLWGHCLEVYTACGASADDEDLKAVEQVVKQFHDWDKSGIAFRYATKKDGALVSFRHSSIDIHNLKDVMNGVANFFQGSDGWLDGIANA